MTEEETYITYQNNAYEAIERESYYSYQSNVHGMLEMEVLTEVDQLNDDITNAYEVLDEEQLQLREESEGADN